MSDVQATVANMLTENKQMQFVLGLGSCQRVLITVDYLRLW